MIYEILKIGKKNATSLNSLKKIFGFTDVRAVQKQIECFIKTLENRGNKTLAILDSSKKLLQEFEKRNNTSH